MSEPETFLDGRVTLHCGDSRDVLRAIPDASIHAVVTDPPYALGFMGKQWDTGETAFAEEFWREVLRVLKPGGHVVAFSGTRTYHRMACAIEDAGFEIRDQLAWVYATGFPKSHNQKGDWQGWGTALKPSYEPLVWARKPWPHSTEWVTIASDLDRLEAQLWSMLSAKDAGVVLQSNQAAFAEAMSASAAWLAESGSSIRDDLSALMGMSQFVSATVSSLSTVSSWKNIWAALSDPESMSTIETASKTTIDWRTLKFSLSKITPATIIPAHNSGRWSNVDACPAGRYFNATLSMFDATRERFALASAIDLWQRHSPAEGAPSPSWEPIALARKPLDGTVAANVLAHGTGALNIDGCRVEWPDGKAPEIGTPAWGGPNKKSTAVPGQDGETVERIGPSQLGRWPANIVHDGSPEVVDAFPESNGGAFPAQGAQFGMSGGQRKQNGFRIDIPGTGSAARFFYSAKADANDRIGSKHPTVKPVDLMQWLCRLVTPPSGLVCEKCGTRVHGNRAKNASEAEALRGVRNDVSPDGQSGTSALLFEGMREQFDEAEAPPVRGVSGDISSDGLGAEILRATVRPAMDGEESVDDEGLRHDQEGVPAASYAQPSAGETRVHSRASVRRGAEDRTPVNGGRGGASHQRHKDGQSSRELAVDAKDRSRQDQPASTEHDCMPVLRNGHDDQPPCPHCGGKVSFRHSVILDPFAGTGTTGEAAWREGFSAVLVEREGEYQADIRRRMRLALGGPEERKRESIKARHGHVEAGPLFSNLGAAE
jgi:DNA modification methylase